MQHVESAGAILQENWRRRALSGALALLAEGLPLRRELLRLPEQPLPAVGDARDMQIDRPAELIDEGWNRRTTVAVCAPSKLRPFHHDCLREELVAGEHIAKLFTAGRVHQLLHHDAALARQALVERVPVESSESRRPFAQVAAGSYCRL